jgi:phosphosulfolactate phosphohydrolase-like enzyme
MVLAMDIVVDVVRFSTSAALLCARNSLVYISRPFQRDIDRWRSEHRHGIVFAEYGGRKLHGADYDNSPWEIGRLDIPNVPVLLASTNGAVRILERLGGDIYTCSYVNFSATIAVAKRVQSSGQCVKFIPATDCVEDQMCCEDLRNNLEALD